MKNFSFPARISILNSLVKKILLRRGKRMYRKVAYGIGIFGLCIGTYFSLRVFTTWEIIANATAVSWGMNLIAIALAVIAMGIAKESQKIASDSDQKMEAIDKIAKELNTRIEELNTKIQMLPGKRREHPEKG